MPLTDGPGTPGEPERAAIGGAGEAGTMLDALERSAPTGPRVMLLETAGLRVALLAVHAREVTTAVPAIRLPGAPTVVSGVVTVRGALVPLIDLGCLLGTASARPPAWHVLVEMDGRRLMLGVDSMPTLAPADADPLPHETPTGAVQQQVCVAGEAVPLLDASALADVILLP